LAWGALALMLVEIGLAVDWPFLAEQGHALAALTFGRLFLGEFAALGHVLELSDRLITVLATVALFYYLCWRLRQQRPGASEHDVGLARVYLWMAAVLVTALVRVELGRVLAGGGWALFALGLLVVGVKRHDVDLRYQSYMLGALSFVRGWTSNFQAPDASSEPRLEIGVAAVVIASFYLAEFFVPRDWRQAGSADAQEEGNPARWADRHARELFSILATILLSTLLFHHVAPELLTVAWALEGLMLLA